MGIKPKEREEEYFARLEFERKKKQEEQKQNELIAEERRKLRDLHFMRCPKCGMQLIEIDHEGIRADQCSECSGVWLDAGELEAVSNLEEGLLPKFFKIFRD